MQYSSDYDARFDPAMPMVELTIASESQSQTLSRKALVDSGADATLLSQADLRLLGADHIGWGRMVGISGISQRIPIYTVQLIITLNGLAQVLEVSQ
jgi:hypothetical protein